MSLESYGWDASWAKRLNAFGKDGLTPARVISGHRSAYRVQTGKEELLSKAAGKLFHKPYTKQDLPVVGDWVALDTSDPHSPAVIKHVLPRQTVFSRKFSGKNEREQVMAANVDIVWIVSTFGADLNLARLERYVTLVLESGAFPVIILAKSDLAENLEEAMESVRDRIPGVALHSVSAHSSLGLEDLKQYVQDGQTVALLGSSGVGKTTLINHFLGEEIHHTAAVREKDGKGRHTTTHRELILIPSGGLLLDTPGMRELQLWTSSDSLDKSFTDIEELAAECRFSDCKHESEPGCAVNAALESGDLSPERFENYKKLERELSYLGRRSDKDSVRVERDRLKARTKEIRRISQDLKRKVKGKWEI